MPLEKRFNSKITIVLNRQADEISKAFKKYMNERKSDDIDEKEAEREAEEISNNIYKTDEGVQTITKSLLPLYINAAELGNEFFNNIHFTNEGEGTLFAIIREDYLQWLNEYGAEQVVNINTTTKELTRRIIKDGLLKGDSIDSISKELSSKIKQYSKARAVNISQTEIHNSFMKANFLTANKSGFKYKRWLSARDESVRLDHKAYDSLGWVEFGYMYAPGLEYPGDSRANVSQVARCRCVLRYAVEREG
ncbi:hypothetical protein [Clostridium rectalis]|uniref:hypothetical protein n=1 Tax=Clostridium rectalis TaxID=2040295 RepID=UPI0013DE588B|nr:hypothetical protein [Clostridium rectalis]